MSSIAPRHWNACTRRCARPLAVLLAACVALPGHESRKIIVETNRDVMIYDLTSQGVVAHSNWGAVRYAADGSP